MNRLEIINFAKKKGYSLTQHLKDDWRVTKLNMRDRLTHPFKTAKIRKKREEELNKKYPKTAKAIKTATVAGAVAGTAVGAGIGYQAYKHFKTMKKLKETSDMLPRVSNLNKFPKISYDKHEIIMKPGYTYSAKEGGYLSANKIKNDPYTHFQIDDKTNLLYEFKNKKAYNKFLDKHS